MYLPNKALPDCVLRRGLLRGYENSIGVNKQADPDINRVGTGGIGQGDKIPGDESSTNVEAFVTITPNRSLRDLLVPC